MIVFAIFTAFVMLAPIYQPYETICETAQIISLEKSIIEQKYAAEVKLPEKTTIIYTNAEIYNTLEVGKTINICHSEGKWIPTNQSNLWIEAQ